MSELLCRFIGGEWVPSASGKMFEGHNPTTGELVGSFVTGTSKEVDAAVGVASRAYRSWRLYPASKRGEILFKAARLLEARKEELAREMSEDMGKVLDEFRGDVQEAVDMTY